MLTQPLPCNCVTTSILAHMPSSRQDRKHCRCHPNCYKILSYSAWKIHYRQANQETVLESDYGSEVERGAIEVSVLPIGA